MTTRTRQPTDELLAHIAWNRVTEPGDWLATSLVQRLGAIRAFDWLSTTTAPVPPTMDPDPRWQRVSDNWRARLTTLDPRREFETITNIGGTVLTADDPRWPAGFDDLHEHAPLCLWVRGDPAALGIPGIGIVGARASTRYGERVAADLAAGVVAAGLSVVSGGAFGVDAAAHRAALASDGVTVVFQAGGVDKFYPIAHTDLLHEVCASGGVVVSEAPPGSAPMRQRFLMRNRLIAAASQAVVVVEASWRSGALNTARHATELLRPLGAVPGPVTSMSSAGCHRIIREGMAVCITDAAELLELAGPLDLDEVPHAKQTGVLDGLDPETARVLDAFPLRQGTTVDALVHVAGLSAQSVMQAIGRLQLAGKIRLHEGRWKRVE